MTTDSSFLSPASTTVDIASTNVDDKGSPIAVQQVPIRNKLSEPNAAITSANKSTERRRFSLQDYLLKLDAKHNGKLNELLKLAEGRRLLTKNDPLLFALVYLPHHLRVKDGPISFADFHVDLYRSARGWVQHKGIGEQQRDIYVCPRGTGKTTQLFLLLPIWMAAHGHRKYIAAFSDTVDQAQRQLKNFVMEITENELLKNDFPELCSPKMRRGKAEADRADQYMAESGFIFAAKGMNSATLGLKIGNRRPDFLLLDEIEPAEADYNIKQCEERFDKLVSSILNLEQSARVVLTGTVTMPGSIIHQAVEGAAWVKANGFEVHHYLPVVEEAGDERSMWPERWPLEWLKQQEQLNPRMYAKDYLNKPIPSDGIYWTPDDFEYGSITGGITYLSIDPAVTTKEKSDYTAFAIVSYSPKIDKYEVKYSLQSKMSVAQIQKHVEKLRLEYKINVLMVETNQGGDLWKDVFKNSPLGKRAVYFRHHKSKEERAADALFEYQQGKVVHSQKMTDLEGQMCAFPNSLHDDLVDAVCSAITSVKASMERIKRRKGK